MTNQEYFISQLGFAPTAGLVESSLTDAGLTGSSAYDVANKIALKTAILSALHVLLSVADTTQGFQETVNSIKYDRNAILKRIGILDKELGVSEALPIITSRVVW